MALSVAAAVAGVSIAPEAGAFWPIVLIMGVATGTFGGLKRDVVTNEIPLVSTGLAGLLLSVLVLRLFPAGETLSLLTPRSPHSPPRRIIPLGRRIPVHLSPAPQTFR